MEEEYTKDIEKIFDEMMEGKTEEEKIIIREHFEIHKKLDEEDREHFRKRAEYYYNKFHSK